MNPSFIDAKLLFLQTKSITICNILIFIVLYLPCVFVYVRTIFIYKKRRYERIKFKQSS